ncbi:glycosyltransferase family 2 protein [Sulfuriferula thiophila]|uniref:glycosyltransferase family 2 protein n=1 Tax=Sulfuriferula thiophila TaxID=1781211 RepID=UPI000F613EC4|nr:glycosyltransferase family 2 protein [Sulfuriferula thiophila]
MTLQTSKLGAVTILLSTYNGGKFLQQQLDTLYQQTYPNIRMLVRDDGSSDSTKNVLGVEQLEGRVDVLESQNNLGPALSFFELLRQAALTDTAYVAFCDQDDVWQPEKITQAVSALSVVANERPAMYCTRVELVDEHLVHISFGDVPRKIGFGNALVENIATGCTIVLNRKAIDLLCENLPSSPQMHDWWCYLVLSCFGEVIFDPAATIKYRQHGNNTIGVATNIMARYGRRFRRFFGRGKQRAWCSDHAMTFLKIYGNRIPPPERHVIDHFIAAKSSFWSRLKLVFSREVWRQKLIDNLILRILILINRI